jgi:PIN like domain
VASLTFYFDRNFGKRFPSALKSARPPFDVEYHHSVSNNFQEDMTDDQWLQICGAQRWIVFSHDDKFHRIKVEAMAIRQHNVAAFSVWGAQLPVWDKMCHFCRAYPRMRTIIRNERPPYLYRVTSALRFNRVELP